MAEKPKIRRFSLSFKLSIVFIVFFIFVVAPFIFWLYLEIRLVVRESLRKELMGIASLASAVVDAEKHEQITRPDQEGSSLYEEVRRPLKLITEANPDIDSIYTWRPTKKEDVFLFVVDSEETKDRNGNGMIEPEEERAHIGEEYDISIIPEVRKAFVGPSADREINCDKWGCWLSGYAPIKDKVGETVAIVGVDMDVENVVILEKDWQRILLVFLFFVLVFSLIFISIIRLFTRSIKKITKGIEEFSKNLNYRFQIKTGDEFELIANEFNIMAEQISQSHRELEKRVQEKTARLQKANKDLKKTYGALLNISEDLKEANKKLEETNKKLREADEMRKNFVSHTTHELRTPLNVFRWSIEMLRNEDLGKINLKQREVLDQVYQSNERLLTLVNDLLEVSRIDEVRLKVKIAPCQIEKIIDEAVGNLAVKIREKRFDFVWKKPALPLPKVLADKDRILQVLLNILGNAVKFTPASGKIEVSVLPTNKIAPPAVLKKYGFVQKDKKYVLVSVSDTGLGIPKVEQKKMFTRFFRGSNVQKVQIEGTGLGMVIVFEIIKLHNGAIWFESEEGIGTTFYFTLPVV